MENSVRSSEVGPGNSAGQQEASNIVESHAPESKVTDWTDEKHSLYLKSMEATFVNQLYKSLDLSCWLSQKKCASKTELSKHSYRNPAGSVQFKVFRDGHWSKIHFRGEESQPNQEKKTAVLLANPWIRHYRSSDMQLARKSPAVRIKDPFAAGVNQCPADHTQLQCRDSAGSITEVTDQNFSDDDLDEDKSHIQQSMKRTKISAEKVPCNDHVMQLAL